MKAQKTKTSIALELRRLARQFEVMNKYLARLVKYLEEKDEERSEDDMYGVR